MNLIFPESSINVGLSFKFCLTILFSYFNKTILIKNTHIKKKYMKVIGLVVQ
jgi:hypothetical protein